MRPPAGRKRGPDMYEILYKAADGCREIQRYVNSTQGLLALLREWATEPCHRTLRIVSVAKIVKSGAYGNRRSVKRLDAAALTAEALRS